MADSKHTPGPWETGQAHWNEDGDVMYTLHGIKEAKVADCRLIAAAPELLDAVKAANSWLERWAVHVGSCEVGSYCTCGLTANRAETARAIAKAEGRS